MATHITFSSNSSTPGLSPAAASAPVLPALSPENRIEASAHPHDQYLSLMADKMDPDGSLKAPGGHRLNPSKAGRENIQRYMLEKQQLGTVTWDLHQLLVKLLEYFSSKTMKGTQVEVTSGGLYWMGKEGWMTTLQERLQMEDLEKQTHHSIWNFCTEAPDVFEINFCCPPGTANLEMFLELGTYLIAIQAHGPLDYVSAIQEFGRIIDPNHRMMMKVEMIERLQAVTQTMEILRKFIRTSYIKANKATLELPFHQKRLKIVFGFTAPSHCYRCDTVCLKLLPESNGLVEIVSYGPPLQALHQLLAHRLVPTSPPNNRNPAFLGQFWRYLTQKGRLLFPHDLFSGRYGTMDSILLAFNADKVFLSNHNHLIAYYFHAIQYLMLQNLNPKEKSKLTLELAPPEVEKLTPLSTFLHTNFLLPETFLKERWAVLIVTSILQLYLPPLDGQMPCSRPTTNGVEPQIEVMCSGSSPFYLVLPDHLNTAMEQLSVWLKTDPMACLSCFSYALMVFFPTFAFNSKTQASPRNLENLQEIYKALRSHEQFTRASLVCFLAMVRAGWITISEEDVLALPRWLSLPESLPCIEAAFRNTPFQSLLQNIKGRLNQREEVWPVCLEEMIVSGNPQLVSRAWMLWNGWSKPLQYISFMRAIRPHLILSSLPVVAGGLREIKRPEDRMELLVAYLHHLTSLPHHEPVLLNYGPVWCEQIGHLLENDPSLSRYLDACPQILPVLINNGQVLSLTPDEASIRQLQAYVESSMDVHAPVGRLLPAVRFLREKETFKRLPPAFLLKVLQYLIQTSHQEQKIQNPEVYLEIDHLIEGIHPENGTAASIAESAAAYYRALVENRFAGKVLQENRLALLSPDQKKSLAAAIVSVLARETEPDQIWNLLTDSQKIVREFGDTEIVETFMKVTERFAASPGSSKREGFASFMNGIFQDLQKKEEYNRILKLLPHTPLPELYSWHQTCLQHLLDKKAAAAEVARATALLLKSGAVEYLPSSFLVNLLEYLVERSTEEKKIYREINDLKDRIQPAKEDIYRFLGTLLSYYSVLLSSGETVLVVEDITRRFSLFRTRTGYKFYVLLAASVLIQTPKDKEVWQKFAILFELLKNEPTCVEVVLSLFEALTSDSSASFQDPPFQVFRKGLVRFEKKLSGEQKKRFGKILIALLMLAKKEKKEAEVWSFFPPVETVLSLIQNEESWATYADLVLDLAAEGKIRTFSSSMLWIAPRLLSSTGAPAVAHPHPTLISRFRTFLTRMHQNELKTPEWKRIIAGVVAAQPESSGDLLYTLSQVATPEEKRFFDRCRGLFSSREHLSLQRVLGVYHATGAISTLEEQPAPKVNHDDSRKKIEGLLSGNALTHDLISMILTLLEKYPEDDYDLWEKLFVHLKGKPKLVQRAWKIWLAKHPVKNVLSAHAKYWKQAIYTVGVNHDIGIEVIDDFIIHHLALLLERLPVEESHDICTIYMKVAIISSWESSPGSYRRRIQAVLDLSVNEKIKEKIPSTLALLEEQFQIQLALLCASSDDLSLSAGGQGHVLGIFNGGSVREPTENTHRLFLKLYCEKPCFFRRPQDQEIFHRWVERRWPVDKHRLSWIEVCNLIRVLCHLNFSVNNGATTTFDPETIYQKWVAVASEEWEQQTLTPLQGRAYLEEFCAALVPVQEISLRDPKPFFDATRRLMQKLFEGQVDPTRRCAWLSGIYEHLNRFIDRLPRNSPIYPTIIPYYIGCALKDVDIDIPDIRPLVGNVLGLLKAYSPVFTRSWNVEIQFAVESFNLNLHEIIRLSERDPGLLDLIVEICDLFMNVPTIRNAPPEPHFSWGTLLYSWCIAIQNTQSMDHRKRVAHAAVQLFSRCTHGALLKTKNNIPTTDQKNLINLSIKDLAFSFLSIPALECLEVSEWNSLLAGLSEPSIRIMLEALFNSDKKADHRTDLTDLLSAARILRYIQPKGKELLTFLQLRAMEITAVKIPNFQENEDPLVQLLVRSQFILALESLKQKCQAMGILVQVYQVLDKQKQRLTVEFVQLYLKYSDETNVVETMRMLREIVHSADLGLLSTINDILQIRHPHPISENPALILHMRVEALYALDFFIKKCKTEGHTGNIEGHEKKQKEKIGEFIQYFLRFTDEKNFSATHRILVEVVRIHDLPLRQFIHENFQIYPNRSEELTNKLNVLKRAIASLSQQ